MTAGTGAQLSWRDRSLSIRDRLLASPRFRRWAAAFPLTRPIARRRARELFDLCGGFVYSQVLLACVRLHLFDILAEGPQPLDALTRRLRLPPEAADRLLSAAVALRLVARRGSDRYGLGPLGAAMVGNPGIAAMVEHHPLLYADLRDPVALLRGEGGPTELGRYWAYAAAGTPASLDRDQVAAYTALMSASQSLIAEEVLDAVSLAKYRRLLDVGGGDGTFLAAAGDRWPDLQLVLFDLPPVAERARVRFAQAGLADRAEALGGDFRADGLPRGADIVSLVRVVHDHDDDVAMALLRAVRIALPPGGMLLLAEPLAGTPGAESVGDAYFGFYLLAMGSGRPRSANRLEQMLREAGFGNVRRVPTRMPLQTGILLAYPDESGSVNIA
jgi:demethylspheroidene O-methyltransferase